MTPIPETKQGQDARPDGLRLVLFTCDTSPIVEPLVRSHHHMVGVIEYRTSCDERSPAYRLVRRVARFLQGKPHGLGVADEGQFGHGLLVVLPVVVGAPAGLQQADALVVAQRVPAGAAADFQFADTHSVPS